VALLDFDKFGCCEDISYLEHYCFCSFGSSELIFHIFCHLDSESIFSQWLSSPQALISYSNSLKRQIFPVDTWCSQYDLSWSQTALLHMYWWNLKSFLFWCLFYQCSAFCCHNCLPSKTYRKALCFSGSLMFQCRDGLTLFQAAYWSGMRDQKDNVVQHMIGWCRLQYFFGCCMTDQGESCLFLVQFLHLSSSIGSYTCD